MNEEDCNSSLEHSSLETRAIHEGYTPDHTRSRVAPIYRNAAYVFRTPDQSTQIFALKEFGNIYSRVTNPTLEYLEKRVSALEGGKETVCFASGSAAIYGAILNIAKCGEEFISASTIYGGTHAMFKGIIGDSGIKAHFVDPYKIENFETQINEKTRFIFIETIGNPALSVLDIEKIAEMAHKHGLPLMVDATFSTPYVVRSIDYGADIVINSLTKWIGGHGSAIGGSVTDSGAFPWADNPRFAVFNTPLKSYENRCWAKDFGERNNIAYSLRLRQDVLRNAGACLSPDNAWIFIQGLESLAVRIERHSANALEAAKFLETHPKVQSVNYPGLETDSAHSNAKKYFTRGLFGGMVVVTLKGGRKAGEEFIAGLDLFSHLANVGDTRSLAIHPASTTHGLLSEEDQIAAGVDPGAIRLSIGIEHIEDIIKDLQKGLDAITS